MWLKAFEAVLMRYASWHADYGGWELGEEALRSDGLDVLGTRIHFERCSGFAKCASEGFKTEEGTFAIGLGGNRGERRRWWFCWIAADGR